jgi:hypothetical protein
VQRGHGIATRLLIEDVDLEKVDSVVASGGTDADVARTTMINTYLGPGRFGKMFPDLEPFRPPVEALIDLGEKMIETSPGDPALNNSDVPAGFTYLGQFIDHDITFDRTPDLPDIVDPEQMRQERTPTLDLDSLYGRGPKLQSSLYDQSVPKTHALFKIGLTSQIPSPGGSGPGTPTIPVSLPNDLPREPDKKAIIGDERNDENTIVAQTHVAFLKFHNALMRSLPKGQRDDEDDGSAKYTQAEEVDDRKRSPFHRARRIVRWHYQWLVLNDFLSRLIDPGVLNDVRTNGRRFYNFDPDPFNGEPFMPIEFSVAAYRLGHSMVRERYNFNRVFASSAVEPNAITPATLGLLFAFTGKGGFPAPPGGHTSLPSNWIIDWRRFFDLGRPDLLNVTRNTDTKLVPQLANLPEPVPAGQPPSLASLAVRNLLRGRRVGLPTGQAVAEAMEVTPLAPGAIAGGDDGETLRQHGFDESTPLWYYVLKEAELQGGGKRLGEVGSRIVAEVFFGLVQGDPYSFLSREPDWTPTLRSATPGTFTMADLLMFVGDINPVGPGAGG